MAGGFKLALLKQLAAFGATGAFSLLTNLGVTYALHEFAGVAVELSYVGGYLSGILVTYFICRYLVFDAAHANAVSQFTKFLVSSLLFRGVELIVTIALYRQADLPYLLVPVIVVSLSFFGKFFFYRARVFVEKDKASR